MNTKRVPLEFVERIRWEMPKNTIIGDPDWWAERLYRWALNAAPLPVEPVIDGNTSDGHHTFNELYAFRLHFNAALFNEWASRGLYQVHKATRHHNGDPCFGGGWFIVVAMLPTGQISNHYKMEYWDQFSIPAHEKVLFPYDGHTGTDTLNRLAALSPVEPTTNSAQISRKLVCEADGGELLPCPCGQVPTEIGWDISDGWLIASSATCCGQWYTCAECPDDADGDECQRLADESWNTANRRAPTDDAELRRLVSQVFDILEAAPELNMCNYGEDQVSDLNNKMIEAYLLMKDAMVRVKPTGEKKL